MSEARSISPGRMLAVSLAVTLAVWTAFSWPLPRYVFSGIPSSSQNIEKGSVRRMMAGDHLQLSYHYWIFGDMLAGKTPWFSNIYEFNTGNDAARRNVNSYNMPFSLVYAAGELLGGRAFGWNFTGVIALWLTHLFTWLLVRRYGLADWPACLVAAIGVALPYRWVALLGGSPTGYAMLWIPAIMLGLDRAVRDSTFDGGVLAAVTILLLYWTDRQTFFYAALVLPGWCIISFVGRDVFGFGDRKWWGRLAWALVPVAVVFAFCAFDATFVRRGELAGTVMDKARGVGEVGLYSPMMKDLFVWRGFGKTGHAYVGYVLPVALALGLLLRAAECVSSSCRRWRGPLRMGLLCLALVIIALWSTGPNGPADGFLFKASQKWLPFYSKVRQTGKVYCMLPTLLAVAVACGLSAGEIMAGAWRRRILPMLLAGLICVEYACQVRATVCLLDTEQPAYEAVADDARENGRAPRVLVAPLWPGDSAWASLYEHYASLYRIRMINGYRPAVAKSYVDEIMPRFGMINGGLLPDAQADDLLSRGIEYVIFHEDAFPEQVCSFPACFALKNFLNSPRLELLKQGESVWAFRILGKARPVQDGKPGWNIFFPARSWEMETTSCWNAVTAEAPDASGGKYLVMSDENSRVQLREARHWNAPDGALLLRARGHGSVVVTPFEGTAGSGETAADVDSDEWTWLRIPVAAYPLPRLNPSVRKGAGMVDLDVMTFVSGQWPMLANGESVTFPACLFFHAGYTDLEHDSVKFRADREPADAILYGPKLPLSPGVYKVSLLFDSPAGKGTVLGSFAASARESRMAPVPVVVGEPAEGTFAPASNLPVRFEFIYSRNADVELKAVVLTKL